MDDAGTGPWASRLRERLLDKDCGARRPCDVASHDPCHGTVANNRSIKLLNRRRYAAKHPFPGLRRMR